MRLIAALVALALACGACGIDPKGNSMDADEQFATLMQRPDIEQAQTQYLALLESIRSALVDRLGIAAWKPKEREAISGSGCGFDFSDVDGHVRRYSSGHSPGNIPDAQWPAAVAIVTELAKPQGFGDPGIVVDRPGDHEVALHDTYGAELWFGTAVNTTLSLSTGCHLSKAAHERGTQGASRP